MNPSRSDHFDDDPFHLGARSALAPVVEAFGVVAVEATATTRTWTFEDELVVHERRHQHEPLGPVQALAAVIRDVDAEDDDQARLVRLALAEVLAAARETVGDERETVVLRELGAVLSEAGIASATVTVEHDRVVVEPVEVVEPDDQRVTVWRNLLTQGAGRTGLEHRTVPDGV